MPKPIVSVSTTKILNLKLFKRWVQGL